MYSNDYHLYRLMSMSCMMYSNLLKTNQKSHVTSLQIVGRSELYDVFIFLTILDLLPTEYIQNAHLEKSNFISMIRTI